MESAFLRNFLPALLNTYLEAGADVGLGLREPALFNVPEGRTALEKRVLNIADRAVGFYKSVTTPSRAEFMINRD